MPNEVLLPRFTFENFIPVPTNKPAYDKRIKLAELDAPGSNPILLTFTMSLDNLSLISTRKIAEALLSLKKRDMFVVGNVGGR